MKLDDNIAYIKNRTMKKEEHCNYFLWVTFSIQENQMKNNKLRETSVTLDQNTYVRINKILCNILF